MCIAKWCAAFWLAFVSIQAAAVDPTQPIDAMPPPPGMGGVESSGISVNMILIRGGHAMALVNGRFVHLHDEVAGAKVTDIGRNYVELQQGSGKKRHYLAGFGEQTGTLK